MLQLDFPRSIKLLASLWLWAASVVPAIGADPEAAIQGTFRSIPAGTFTAVVRSAGEMNLIVNGSLVQLPPGVRIRDTENRFALPTTILTDAVARLRLGIGKEITDIWLLSAEEIARSGTSVNIMPTVTIPISSQ